MTHLINPRTGILLSIFLANSAFSGIVTPSLEAQLAVTGPQEPIRVLVILSEQIDVSNLDRDLKSTRAARSQRHSVVVGALQKLADKQQEPLLAFLKSAKKSSGEPVVQSFHPHWLINAVVVTATPDVIRDLANRPEVEQVESDLIPEIVYPVEMGYPDKTGASPNGFNEGLGAINVQRVWNELGIDGTGTLVGLIDSGADGDHPAFASRWQGHFAPPETAWLDAAQTGNAVPTDLHYHGTHVLGIMTGGTPGDSTGVAPGAHWLATNSVYASWSLFDNAILAGLEFMTDPDGDPATTSDVPDVVNNSWGIPRFNEDYPDCDSRWWQAFDNCEAAGVVLIWAAGNEGPSSGTVRPPADRSSGPYNTFAVGSTGTAEPYTVSDFSSRGPSGCGGDDAIKPEVAAPGEDIYSASPGGGYWTLSGTSMAAPHVSGVVALMRQANPDVDVVTIKHILMATAQDLGPAGEDNETGHGIIDAYAAVQAVMNGLGAVSGQVRDPVSGLPVPYATITRVSSGAVAITDSDGRFGIETFAGTATFAASAFGYISSQKPVTVTNGGAVVVDFLVSPQSTLTVSGLVIGPDLLPIAGAGIQVNETPVAAVTDPDGSYWLDLPPGSYSLRAQAQGLGFQLQTIDLGEDATVDFVLPGILQDDFESGDFLALPWEFAGDAPWLIDGTNAYEGLFSARAGDIDNRQASTLLLDCYITEPGELAFHYRVSSQSDGDYLKFSVDGSQYIRWSGDTGWHKFSTTIDPGRHVFQWSYWRYSSTLGSEDTAWIDVFQIPPTGVEPIPELVLDTSPVSLTVPPGETAIRSLFIGNTGNGNLNYSISTELLSSPEEFKDKNLGFLSAPWVSVDPSSGAVAPGLTAETVLTFDSDGLEPGSHVALVTVASNDPNQPEAAIPLILTVDTASGVGDQPGPLRVEIHGAVPNPFNPRTEIQFSLRKEGPVRLAIYDLLGRQSRTLVSHALPAGGHVVVWDGRDDRGMAVSSGTYFARLVSEGEVRTAAMTLLR